MSLIDDDGVVLRQIVSVLDGIEQNAIGHHLDASCFAGGISEANLVTNQPAEFNLKLLGNALSDRSGSDATRLGVSNGFAAKLKTHLGQLGSFSRASSSGNHNHLVVLDGFENLMPKLRNRKVFRVVDSQISHGCLMLERKASCS